MKKLILAIIFLLLTISLCGCEFITKVVDKANNAWDVVSNDLASQIFKDVDYNNVTSDLYFPTEFKKYTITYQSMNENVIDNTGKVTRPELDTLVKVIVTFTEKISDTEYSEQDFLVHFIVKGYLNNDNPTDNTTKTTKNVTENKTSTKESISTKESSTTPSLEELSSKLNNVCVEMTSIYVDQEDEAYTITDDVLYIYTDDIIYWFAVYDYCLYQTEYENYFVFGSTYDTYIFDYDEEYYSAKSTFKYFAEIGAYDYLVFEFDDEDFTSTYDSKNDTYTFTCNESKLSKYKTSYFTDCIYEVESYVYELESYEITVKDNEIYSIVLEFTYTESYDSESFIYDCISELYFSEYGLQELELPEYTELSDEVLIELFEIDDTDYDDDDDDDDSEDLYYIYNESVANGTLVAVNGNIIGLDNKQFFVYDGDTAITCYYGTNKNYNWSSLKVGDYITLTGTKKTFNGLVEINVDANSIEIDKTKTKLYSVETVKDIDDINNILSQGKVVNIENYTITKEFQKLSSTSSEYLIEVEDAYDNTIEIIFKGSNVSNFNDDLSEYKVEDSISFNNLVVYWYKGVQFLAIYSTELVNTQLKLSKTQITVENGTELSDAMKGITVTLNGETITNYTYTCTNYNKTKVGSYTVTVNANDEVATLTVVIKSAPTETTTNSETVRIVDAASLNDLTVGLKSTGNVKVLVFPIEFSDKKFEDGYKEKIDLAFNGTSEETGYESLHSYYYKSSYGKLNITATILDAYEVSDTWKKVKGAISDSYLDYDYLLEVITYYDSLIDYSEYDANEDGYIDCIYLIYSASYNTDDEDTIWWAFTNEYIEDEEEALFDNIGLDYYTFLSYEFFNDPIMYSDDDDSSDDDTYITVNAVTIIHETGHVLGLDDYYDYDLYTGPTGGIGGGDMMDYNVGDHNAYSKALLNWIDPIVLVNKTGEYTLNSFTTTGESIIIAKDWDNSLFSEYYIIDFYTPDGVNELTKGYTGSFSEKGIRIYHVYSTLDEYENCTASYDMTIYDNSSTEYKLISLVEADGENNITEDDYPYGGYSENSDLFKANDTYTFKWYDGTSSNIKMTVKSLTDTAVIEFTSK